MKVVGHDFRIFDYDLFDYISVEEYYSESQVVGYTVSGFIVIEVEDEELPKLREYVLYFSDKESVIVNVMQNLIAALDRKQNVFDFRHFLETKEDKNLLTLKMIPKNNESKNNPENN